MDASSVTTGILLRDVAHVQEVHGAIADWLAIQGQIEKFDQESENESRGVDGAGCLPAKDFPSCYGIKLSRAEVRRILVDRRIDAEKILENKGVRVGRMEGVR